MCQQLCTCMRMHWCCRSGGLDHPVRPAGRPEGVHTPRGPHGARQGRQGPRAAHAAARGARLPHLPQGALADCCPARVGIKWQGAAKRLCSVVQHLAEIMAASPTFPAFVPQAAKVPLNEYEFPSSKIANVQSQLEKLVEKNYYLHQSARDAYRFAALLQFPSTRCAASVRISSNARRNRGPAGLRGVDSASPAQSSLRTRLVIYVLPVDPAPPSGSEACLPP